MSIEMVRHGATHHRALIGSVWVDAQSGAEIEGRDPATDQLVATVPGGGRDGARAAIDAAYEALPVSGSGRVPRD